MIFISYLLWMHILLTQIRLSNKLIRHQWLLILFLRCCSFKLLFLFFFNYDFFSIIIILLIESFVLLLILVIIRNWIIYLLLRLDLALNIIITNIWIFEYLDWLLFNFFLLFLLNNNFFFWVIIIFQLLLQNPDLFLLNILRWLLILWNKLLLLK